MGKNWHFNQMRGRFTLPPPSLFFNYTLLAKIIPLNSNNMFANLHLHVSFIVGQSGGSIWNHRNLCLYEQEILADLNLQL
jgi:hypothetical protein